MAMLQLFAPMQGWAAPLDEVPDPVFAEKMLGDGIAIDPLDGVLRAPCDAQVIAIQPSRHAVTLRAVNGAEILIHIGLETVALNGEGFAAHVVSGQSVKTGDPLIGFDLDLLARRAKSLITPMIVTNGEAFRVAYRAADRAVGAHDVVMELAPVEAADTDARGDSASIEASRHVVVPLAHGIHARPAARIANEAKRYESEVALLAKGQRANARSTVAMMTLGLRCGDEALIQAHGVDAEAAVAAIAAMIESGMGELADPNAPAPAKPVASTPIPSEAPDVLTGVCAASGIAVGRAFHLRQREIVVPEAGAGAAHERSELERALQLVRSQLAVAAAKGGEGAAILAAHQALLDDPELIADANSHIARGKSAGLAWRLALRSHADAIRAVGDPRIAERVDDLLDLERQVLAVLVGANQEAAPDLPDDAILIADDLLPSQLIGLNLTRLAGICIAGGGPTSHVAILAASAGVPALVAAGSGIRAVPVGAMVVLNADQGRLYIDPDKTIFANAQEEVETRRRARAAELLAAREICHTADGTRIEVFANVGSVEDAAKAVTAGAEGCGLLRTEFLFLDRPTAPDEDEQLRTYQAVADALNGRPLVIRTLDVGGDKPVPYLQFPPEENPALGLRGIRTSLWRPSLLRTQLRAILRVRPVGQCKIMLPMVTNVAELRAVRTMLDEEARDLGISDRIELGVMIETPASVVLADQIAAEADFFSVGTNDLTQYVLAMDRGNPQLAAQVDALNPAVLRLIAAAAETARAKDRWIGVCGALAADPLAAPILVGLGVTELSATPATIPELKARVQSVSIDSCRALARRVLQADSAAAVRALAAEPMTNDVAPARKGAA